MIQVTSVWRHPIKGHGREMLNRVTLNKGQSMPYDRLWAVAHDAAKIDGTEWAACSNFSRGAKSPSLMAITTTLDETTETITLRHPEKSDLTVQPDSDPDTLIEWVSSLANSERAMPARIFRLDERSFTDSPFPSISLCNQQSHSAVEALANAPLQTERWRGNIWFDGTPAWSEFDWIGREIKLGTACLKIEERITRCRATTVNTDNGVPDVDTLKALKCLDHQNFGIYARVIQTGQVAVGDQLELI